MYLNCHSHFSLRFGTFSEKVLLELAQENGVEALALTDVNNTSACLNFMRLAPQYGVKPIVGIDFRDGATTLREGEMFCFGIFVLLSVNIFNTSRV